MVVTDIGIAMEIPRGIIGGEGTEGYARIFVPAYDGKGAYWQFLQVHMTRYARF